ncbi:MAG: nitrilase-related carbon-nitrogen hydrolase [Bacteroidota bacterium]
MRVAVVQSCPVFGKPGENIERALESMASIPADLYILPELCTTGYAFSDKAEAASLAENAYGRTFEKFSEFARRHNAFIVYGFAENTDVLYNSSLLAGPYGFIGLYRKVHLFDREKLFFAPGNLGFPVYETPLGTIGMMICFDWLFPESARSLALQGVQLIAHPANLVLPYCPDAMVTRCLENHVFTATANRVGNEQRGGASLHFIGTSEVVDPNGNVLLRLSPAEEQIAAADIDLSQARNKRINERNDVLTDRRPDQYSAG